MGILDTALTLITLLSLFFFGPALGRALLACDSKRPMSKSGIN
jgi:hypothetical protein